MIFKRATIPLIIVFVMGVLALAIQYVPHPTSKTVEEEVNSGFKIIGGFALFIGVYSLFHLHFSRIRRRVQGWGYSIFVFLGAAGMIIAGLYNSGAGPLGQEADETSGDWFNWGYMYVFNPAQATIFSILAFFMASAAFRTFRAKSLSAALLLIAAIIVMIGRVPVGEEISRWMFHDSGAIPKTADAIMEYPNLAAKRGIMLGISLGAIAQSVRILFGLERSYLGGGE